MPVKLSAVPVGSEADPCCCGEPSECCPYRYYRLNGIDILFGTAYDFDDLPTTVNVIIDGTPVTVTKTNSDPIWYTGTWLTKNVWIASGWRFIVEMDPEAPFVGPGGGWAAYDTNCLITDSTVPNEDNPVGSPGVVTIEDVWEETYTAEPGDGWGTAPFDIDRDTMCCYEGTGSYVQTEEPFATIEYQWRVCFVWLDPEGDNEYVGWAARFPSVDPAVWYVKQEDQLSPVGKYSSVAWPGTPDFTGTVFEVS
jgi:hypothetical protein